MRLADLAKREKWICHICGKKVLKLDDATREHVIPKALGGTAGENSSNLRLAHKWCNKAKGNKAFRAEQHMTGWVIVDPANQIISDIMPEMEARAIAAEMNEDKLYLAPEYDKPSTSDIEDIVIVRKAK